jgi:hypothetical protein
MTKPYDMTCDPADVRDDDAQELQSQWESLEGDDMDTEMEAE